VLAGQPPTISTDLGTAMAYFRHPELALIDGYIGVFVGAIAVVAFGLALRTTLRAGGDARAATFADIGLALLLVTIPIYVVSSVIGATLVHAADGDAATFATLFRLYETIYDGAADVLEGAWIGAFAVAVLYSPMPRWLGWLGVVLGLSRWVKATIPFGGPVEAIIPISGILFVAWFLAIVVTITLAARRPATAPSALLAHP
jgi:hypothetical protein